ncbi:MAG: TIGR01777 family oxidoreductase [Thermoanaerobaculia bacterium]
MSERVVITGGTGLLGLALAHRLAASGREIVLLSRSVATASSRLTLPPGCRLAAWDGSRADGWLELASGAAAIVNLAGESIAGGRWSRARKARIASSRQQSTAAVMAAIAQAARPPRVLVQASAIGYYGDRADELLSESALPGDGFLAQTAREWEDASLAAERFGVRRVVARTGVVLAREGGAFPKMALPFRLGAGATLGSGRQWMSWIHLADESAALELLIDHPAARGAINLTAPAPVTQAAFARALAAAVRRPLFARAPAFALRALLGEMADLVLASQRVVPQRLLELGFRFRYPTLDAALGELCAPPAGEKP